MRAQLNAAALLSAAIFLAACEGDDGINGTNGADGSDGADGFNSLVATREILPGDAVCLGGGLALDSGLDTNRNDVLDPDEVTSTEFLECEATPTLRALHASPDAPAVDLLADDNATPVDDAIALTRNVAFPAACVLGSVPAPGSPPPGCARTPASRSTPQSHRGSARRARRGSGSSRRV